LVTLECSQIPDIDYSDNYSPVANDLIFRMCLLIMLAHKLKAACIELETAFLYGVLSLKIYLKITEEYDLEHEMAEDDCLLQRHSIDRLIQAAIEWYNFYTHGLIQAGFWVCNSDPCLLYKYDEDGSWTVHVYVDDNMVMITDKEIAKCISNIVMVQYGGGDQYKRLFEQWNWMSPEQKFLHDLHKSIYSNSCTRLLYMH